VVAAAGVGERAGAGGLKQFRPIAGVPMLLRAVRPFANHPEVRRIIVAVPPNCAAEPPQWLRDATGERVVLIAGGPTRSASVRAGFEALGAECTIVLVHDAARPFVSRETIDAVIATAARGVGAVPAVPVGDTLKRAMNGSSRIESTVERTALWRAHTPQGFPHRMLEDLLRRSTETSTTDEAALAEAAGHPVELVPDRTSNLKITTPEDFELAEALARL
jgi:2-C-methyl-D-erythritol 4-phosphate cytidylyltransferase